MRVSPEYRAIGFPAYARSAVGDSSSNGQRNDLAAHFPLHDRQPSHRDWKNEPLRPGAAGIEIEHAVFRLHLRPMRVSGDHRMKAGAGWVELEVLEDVQDMEKNALMFDDFALRQPVRPRALVHVAAHRDDRRDLSQLVENLGGAA